MKLHFIKSFFLFASILSISGCIQEHDEADEPNVDQASFLSNVSNIIHSDYISFNDEINDLSIAIDSLIAKPNQAALDLTQTTLKNSYLAWQKVSAYEFGPAENAALKSSINVYKTDTAQIDANINSGNYDLDLIAMKDAKGLPALDYLLNAKRDSLSIQLIQNKPNYSLYLKAVIDAIKIKVKQTVDDWNSYSSSFSTRTGTDVGSSTGMLVNALNKHYEVFFRDNKIGIPLGVRSSGIARPDFVEAVYGGYSLDLAIENFAAMQKLYIGGVGYGLDDYLNASNASALNNSIQTQMQVIDLKLKALSNPLAQQIVSNPNKVQDLYNEMQKLIVLWKVDMPSRMGVLISYQDNDGD